MNREEEITQTAKEYYIDETDSLFNLPMRTGFITGAKWADENPKEGLVGIEKAAEWVKNILKKTVGEGLAENIKQEFIETMKK